MLFERAPALKLSCAALDSIAQEAFRPSQINMEAHRGPIYIYTDMCVCMYVSYVSVSVYVYIYMTYMAAAQKHQACNRPGRPLCDNACNKIGGSCDKPSRRQAFRRLSTLHTPATRVCNRGPATKVCNRVRGTATNPYFGPRPYI